MSGSRGGELGLRRRADARCGVGSRVGSESHRESPGDAALLHRKKEIKDVGCGLCQAKKMVGRHLGLTGPKEEKRLAREGKGPGRDSSRLQPPDQDLSPFSLSKTDAIFMGGLQGGSKGSAAVGGARAPPAPPLAPSLSVIQYITQ